MSRDTTAKFGCDHRNICEDNGEGSSVCTDCGQILEPVYFYSKKYIDKQTDCEKNLFGDERSTKNKVLLKQRKNEIDIINELQIKWCFPKNVIDETYSLFFHLINTKHKKTRYQKKNIFVFAFHKTLINNNNSHSLYELCNLFEISSLKLFSQLGFEHQLELPPNITDFFNRFCINLEFSFLEKKKIFPLLEKVKKIANIKPETICAITILHYHNTYETKWSKKDIATRCEITYQTLIKNYKKFKKHFLF
jgi:transcription initiation factor TFIIIB Brf1 subunit/transcription initiation factor TFIIB